MTTVPCETCGKPIPGCLRRCRACWGLESHLEDYLKTPRGLALVLRAVKEALLQEDRDMEAVVRAIERQHESG